MYVVSSVFSSWPWVDLQKTRPGCHNLQPVGLCFVLVPCCARQVLERSLTWLSQGSCLERENWTGKILESLSAFQCYQTGSREFQLGTRNESLCLLGSWYFLCPVSSDDGLWQSPAICTMLGTCTPYPGMLSRHFCCALDSGGIV